MMAKLNLYSLAPPLSDMYVAELTPLNSLLLDAEKKILTHHIGPVRAEDTADAPITCAVPSLYEVNGSFHLLLTEEGVEDVELVGVRTTIRAYLVDCISDISADPGGYEDLLCHLTLVDTDLTVGGYATLNTLKYTESPSGDAVLRSDVLSEGCPRRQH